MSLITYQEALAISQAAGNEATLQAKIDEAEGLAAGLLGHALALTAYTERKSIGRDQETVVLQAVPIVIDSTHTFTLAEGISSPTTLTRNTAYDVDQTSGVVTRIDGNVFTEGRRNLTATYYAGYTAATLPAALKQALLNLTGWCLTNAGGGGYQQESMDGYSYTRETLVGGIPQSIALALQLFGRPTCG